jgi:hypothetical protein
MKPGPIVYALVCGVTVFYVMMANAWGIVPFNSSMGRAGSGGSGGHTGTAGYFHK